MRIHCAALVASCLLGSLSAQGTNCQLLGTFNVHGPFNDVWGYTAPNGDEYALLGATTGTVVIDVTNPAAPVERGWFPWANTTWRDIRTYGHYAYVVTEATAGFMIIDLQNPNAPVSLGVFGTANSGNAHNVCVDTGAGRLYLVGCNTGTPVYDLTANPANPTFLGFMTGSGNANYFHDLCVENGYAYGAMIYNGVLRMYDVSAFPPTALSSIGTPGNFTHNAWPNAAGTVCVTTDEVTAGVVKFFDVTNKSSPVPLGQFTPNSASIPHNAYIVGDLCHVSWYTEGYRCIDISDPSNPVEVASYDTWPGASGGYNGNWGCYPFAPSGNILVSDRSTGLYIVKPILTNLAIAHTPLGDTTNEDGPYTVLCDVTSSNPISSINLFWREGGAGAFNTVAMTGTGNPGQYFGNIPGHDAPSEIQYYIEATDSVATRRSPASGQHSFFIGTFNYVFNDDFEQNLGWTHGTTGIQDDWQRGSSAGRSGTSGGIGWQDPVGAYSGGNIWANDLGGPGFDGAYQNNNANWLQSPVIPTNGVQNLRLRFQRWLQLAPGDTGTVLVNGVTFYQSTTGINDSSWQLVDLDISSISNTQPTIQIRFELTSNASVVSGGWSIDDVQVVQISDAAPPLIYGNGTPGTSNVQPAISLSTPACLGVTAQIQGSSILANAGTFAVLNLAPDNLVTSGITLLVQNAGAAIAFGQAGPSGLIQFPFSVPNNPAFDNLYIYSQIIPIDPGSPGGLVSATSGMRFRVCLQ